MSTHQDPLVDAITLGVPTLLQLLDGLTAVLGLLSNRRGVAVALERQALWHQPVDLDGWTWCKP